MTIQEELLEQEALTKAEGEGNYGLMAEFDSPSAIVAAARRTYGVGYRRINAYSPFPIEELSEAIGYHRDYVALCTLICGILGALGGFMLQYWTGGIDYPLNVGGRPLLSLPAFVPITFESTVLLAAFGAFLGNLMMNRLPQPYHPTFNVPSFARASQDRFFLCVKSDDPMYNRTKTRAFLESLGAIEVSNVEK
jgi:Alternative complex III, ActD subunit